MSLLFNPKITGGDWKVVSRGVGTSYSRRTETVWATGAPFKSGNVFIAKAYISRASDESRENAKAIASIPDLISLYKIVKSIIKNIEYSQMWDDKKVNISEIYRILVSETNKLEERNCCE